MGRVEAVVAGQGEVQTGDLVRVLSVEPAVLVSADVGCGGASGVLTISLVATAVSSYTRLRMLMSFLWASAGSMAKDMLTAPLAERPSTTVDCADSWQATSRAPLSVRPSGSQESMAERSGVGSAASAASLESTTPPVPAGEAARSAPADSACSEESGLGAAVSAGSESLSPVKVSPPIPSARSAAPAAVSAGPFQLRARFGTLACGRASGRGWKAAGPSWSELATGWSRTVGGVFVFAGGYCERDGSRGDRAVSRGGPGHLGQSRYQRALGHDRLGVVEGCDGRDLLETIVNQRNTR